jgi:hypothetical protein
VAPAMKMVRLVMSIPSVSACSPAGGSTPVFQGPGRAPLAE